MKYLTGFLLGGVVVGVVMFYWLWNPQLLERCDKVLALDGMEHQSLKETVEAQQGVIELKEAQYKKLLANFDASIQAKSDVEREVESIKALAAKQTKVETLWKETTGSVLFGAIPTPLAGAVSRLASAIKWLLAGK